MEDTSFVNLKNFVGRDDQFKLRYYRQFVELVSQRIPEIESALMQMDRVLIWKLLHGARPQLVFFGLENVVGPMGLIESQHQDMDEKILGEQVNLIIQQMKGALAEMRELTEQLQKQTAQ